MTRVIFDVFFLLTPILATYIRVPLKRMPAAAPQPMPTGLSPTPIRLDCFNPCIIPLICYNPCGPSHIQIGTGQQNITTRRSPTRRLIIHTRYIQDVTTPIGHITSQITPETTATTHAHVQVSTETTTTTTTTFTTKTTTTTTSTTTTTPTPTTTTTTTTTPPPITTTTMTTTTETQEIDMEPVLRTSTTTVTPWTTTTAPERASETTGNLPPYTDNPCKYGEPAKGINQKNLKCSVDAFDCPAGYYCHVGDTDDSTACCERSNPEDPCSLPVDIGNGIAQVYRFYYNPAEGDCARFTYTGAQGNENNFLSYEQCSHACMRWETTCLVTPAITERHNCSSTGGGCPAGQWCHIGSGPQTTLCCGGASTDVCTLPMVLGVGQASLIRWYADPESHSCLRRCKSFMYNGLMGNQNNFLTKEACESVCKPNCENPCGNGTAMLLTEDETPFTCSPTSGCPSDYWCHIGATAVTNVCCPKNGDQCELPLVEGTGQAMLLRYHFDKAKQKCTEFSYHGSQGNANNFLTRSECETACPVFVNPCASGQPLLGAGRTPIVCSGSETCPQGYFCHIGGTPETTSCCPQSRYGCNQSMVEGDGTEHLERWYFDNRAQLCRKFTYHGLRGNANNFLTHASCQAECSELNPCAEGAPLTDNQGNPVFCNGEPQDACPANYYCHVGSSPLTTQCCHKPGPSVCEQPLEIGKGSEALQRWYYDRIHKLCLNFKYNGVAGNQNNFVSEKSCVDTCLEAKGYCPHGDPLLDRSGEKVVSCGSNKPCPNGFICNMNSRLNTTACCQDPADFCLQPLEIGECKNFEKRYGYDPEIDNCVEYEYGGCGGTLNNFESLEKCTEVCCKN